MIKDIFLPEIERFSNAIGVSGHEGKIAELLSETFKDNHLNVVRDGLGGIYASKINLNEKSNKKRVLIVAHMDEVGFLVKEVLPNGLAKLAPVGGIVPESLFGISVCFEGHHGVHKGIFTAVPAHFAKTNGIAAEDLSVDFGFETKEEAIAEGLEVGAVVAFDTKFTPLANKNRFLGKAIDNRYGCAMVATLAQTMFSKDFNNPDVDVVIGATVMEEIGLKGASSAVNLVQPDFVIVLDSSPAADTLPKDNTNGRIGSGVLYRYIDRTMVLGERLKRFMKILLDEYDITHQPYISAGGTDAGKMLELLNGVPTVTACIPARYIHNTGAIFDIRDVEAAHELVWQMTTHYRNDIHDFLHFNEKE